MGEGLLIGAGATGFVVLVTLGWCAAQLRRVDAVIREQGSAERRGDDGGAAR